MTLAEMPTAGGISFTIGPELEDVLERLDAFIAERVLPAEAEVTDIEDWRSHTGVVASLRDEARRLGLYTPHLPERWGGLGLSTLEMALVSERCGASALAPLALNAMAPDEGNMHTLLAAGSPAQLERYLRPLAEGTLRSCFAMTERDVASSDPRNLQTTAVRDGDDWILNGRKWFVTGADGAAFAIVVAKTETRAHAGSGYSLFLVPTDTPGWNVVRDIPIMGSHSVGGHCEVLLEQCRVGPDQLLGAAGAGLEIAQLRLAGGRLAHAMRWIGVAQRALDMTSVRLQERETFGAALADRQALQFLLADSAIDLYAARLMVLHCAWLVDAGRPHKQEVAMVKTYVSEAFGRIVDRAVQVFGSHGIAADLPIERFYRDARAARIYDGASEVHRMVIARRLLRMAHAGESTRAGCGDLP